MDVRLPKSIPEARTSGGILTKAKQTIINGGNFTNVVSNAKDGFEILQSYVATAGFHNSAQRVDPPRCHENTRQAVLQEIFDWMILHDALRESWIAWINGAAGAGKSAICQSIAELCIAQGLLVASFFFFRADPSRNSVRALVPTLTYQVIQLLPELKDIIGGTIEKHPLIFQQSLETQVDELIIKPLRWLQFSGRGVMMRLLIDGVDECNGYENQLDLIRTLSRAASRKDSPIIILFGSRAETHIQGAFRTVPALRRIPLDDQYLPERDIYIFVRDTFARIKNTHCFSQFLPTDWPHAHIIRDIVNSSSGQFIYASTVMTFISDPRSHPDRQLDIIQRLQPSGSITPFAQLDAVYRHVFSQIARIDDVKKTIAYSVLGESVDLVWVSSRRYSCSFGGGCLAH